MFHSGQITAASPLALATAFNAPFLTCPHDSAVVTIRKALAELPAPVRDGTLEEIDAAARPRDLLRQRMEAAAEIDKTPDWDLDNNPEHIALWNRFLGLEKQIMTSRPTPESIVSKFSLLARISVEGSRIEPEEYSELLAEAEQVLEAMPADNSLAHGECPKEAIRPLLVARLERCRRLIKAHEDYETNFFEPAKRQLDAEIAKIPHTTADLGESISGARIIHTTAEKWHVNMARRFVADPSGSDEYMEGHRKIAEAADQREQLIEEARQAVGLAAIIERSNRFSNVVGAAEMSVVNMRVASAAELDVKLTFMIERGIFDHDHVKEALQADTKALASLMTASAAAASSNAVH